MEDQALLRYDLAAVRRMAERVSRALDESMRGPEKYPPPSLAEVKEVTASTMSPARVKPMPDSIMSWAGVSNADATLQYKPLEHYTAADAEAENLIILGITDGN